MFKFTPVFSFSQWHSIHFSHTDFAKDCIQIFPEDIAQSASSSCSYHFNDVFKWKYFHISVLLMFIFTKGSCGHKNDSTSMLVSVIFFLKYAWFKLIILVYMIPILTLPPMKWGGKVSDPVLADLSQTCLSPAQVHLTIRGTGRTSEFPLTAGGLLSQVISQQPSVSSNIRFSSWGNYNWDHEKMMSFCWPWPLVK